MNAVIIQLPAALLSRNAVARLPPQMFAMWSLDALNELQEVDGEHSFSRRKEFTHLCKSWTPKKNLGFFF